MDVRASECTNTYMYIHICICKCV